MMREPCQSKETVDWCPRKLRFQQREKTRRRRVLVVIIVNIYMYFAGIFICFSLCFLVVLMNLKPACLHTSIKFCVNRSVIVSTLLLFSAVFSLFFVSVLSKSRLNSYFALSSQTNFLNSLNVILSDCLPEHLFLCFSINVNEREQWSDRWGSRLLTIK